MSIKDEIAALRVKAERLEQRADISSAKAEEIGKTYPNFEALMMNRVYFDRVEAQMCRADAARLERGEVWGKYAQIRTADDLLDAMRARLAPYSDPQLPRMGGEISLGWAVAMWLAAAAMVASAFAAVELGWLP